MYVKEYSSFRNTLAFFMLSPCRALYAFLISLVVFIVLFVLLASFLPIDEVVCAKALLRPCGVVSSVKIFTSGKVESVNFIDGMTVEKGDTLFSLNVDSYKKELFSQKKEEEKLEKNLLSYEALYNTIITDKIDTENYSAEDLALSYSYFYEKKMKELQTQKAYFEYQSEQAMPEGVRVPYKIEQLRLIFESEKVEAMSWKNAQYASCAQNIKTVQSNITSSENRITELEKAINESCFTSPISGRVIALHKLNNGDNVFSGEEILRIVPVEAEKLSAELYVSASDIAKIQQGNTVHLSFSSLPPSIYGFLQSNISVIPPDCTSSNNSEAFFKVLTSEFPSVLHEKKDKTAFLQSGMEATSRIITGRTTALRLFIKKLDFIQ